MPHNPERSDRVVINLPKELSGAIDDYRRRKLIGTRAEAMRRLMQLGLETDAGTTFQPNIDLRPPTKGGRGRGGQ